MQRWTHPKTFCFGSKDIDDEDDEDDEANFGSSIRMKLLYVIGGVLT